MSDATCGRAGEPAKESVMLTDAQVVEKYGSVVVRFSSYYKYEFSFRGIAPDGAEIYTSYGGSADDIYRYEVVPDLDTPLGNPRDWNHVSITLKGEKIYAYSDW